MSGRRSRGLEAARRLGRCGVLGVFLLTAACWYPRDEGIELSEHLARTLTTCRVVDARVPATLQLSPSRETRTCTDSPDARAAAARVLVRADDLFSAPESAYVVATAHLIQGDVDAALERIERALDRTVTPVLLTTLAAVHLSREPTDAESTAHAVDAAQRAVQLAPALAEAWFNRALALERLGLTAAAATAWQDYLSKDRESEWAKQARTRLELLAADPPSPLPPRERLTAGLEVRVDDFRRAIVSSASQGRAFLEDDVLRLWAECAVAATPRECEARLQSAARLADALLERHGDRTLVSFVRDLSAGCRSGRGTRLARGVLAGIRARAAIDRADVAGARNDLVEARRALADSAAATDLYDFYALMTDYYRSNYVAAVEGLERVARRAASRGHVYVAARSTFMLAAVAVRQARSSDAETLYHRAAELFRRSGEFEYLASTRAILSNRYREQGDTRGSWDILRDTFALLPHVGAPRHLNTIFRAGQSAATEQRLPGLAVHFASALVTMAERERSASIMIPALVDRARQEALTGDMDSAQRSLAQAHRVLADASDPNVRALLKVAIVRAEAATTMRERPCDSTLLFDGVTETVRRIAPNQLAATLLERGRAQRACARDLAAAEASFRAGIEVFEEQRRGQRDLQMRISRLDQAWDLYGELIRLLAIDRRQVDDAFLLAERSRAQSLADTVGLDGPGDPFDPTQLQAGLPFGTTLVSYVVLPDDLLIWTITRASKHFTHVPVSAVQLGRLVARWRQLVADGRDERPVGRELFELILRPSAPWIESDGTLLVVPDGPLHAVPLAALWDGQRYVVERTAVWLTPSARLVPWASQQLLRRPRARGPILAIGDPAHAPERFPRLPRLTHSAHEAAEIAHLYPSHTLLSGLAATPPRILRAMRDADVIHVAAHAVADLRFPLASYIVTAPGPSGEGTITPADLDALRPLTARLVVLSACQTANGRSVRGEGVLSLARAFMTLGVPVVVANLWDASDRASHQIHVDLHRELAGGWPAAEALRRVQLRVLRDATRQPAILDWAGIVGIGASRPLWECCGERERCVSVPPCS